MATGDWAGALWLQPIQLLEYQTDMRRCRFDTLGKLNSAHRAGAPTAREQWVAPAQWVSLIVRSPLWQVHPLCRSTSNCSLPQWRAANRTHPPCGSHPPLTSSGCSCTVGRGRFPHRYKPSSLLRPHIADTSALPMLELGLMPVVTTLPQTHNFHMPLKAD